MNAELIEAIQELGKINAWEIVSVIVGIIGILFTAIVLYFNHKAIKLTQKTMQQTIKLQLYEKRLELYSALSDSDAFQKAPLELKIIFSNEIYDLYAKMVELFHKQVEMFSEAYRLSGLPGTKDIEKICLSDKYYKLIMRIINQEICEYSCLEDKNNKVEKLKKLENDLELVHQEIASQYKILELEMKKAIENSNVLELKDSHRINHI